MKYVNTKTQAVIKTACELKGGDWVKMESDQPEKNMETTVTKKNAPKKRGE